MRLKDVTINTPYFGLNKYKSDVNIKLDLVFKFFFNLKFKDKLNLMKILFKFNMIYKGLNKMFTNEFKNTIFLEEDTNIYSFTRSKKF
jgi:hypothetical protein